MLCQKTHFCALVCFHFFWGRVSQHTNNWIFASCCPWVHTYVIESGLLPYTQTLVWCCVFKGTDTDDGPEFDTEPTCCTAEYRASRFGCHEISGWSHLDNPPLSTGVDNLSIAARVNKHESHGDNKDEPWQEDHQECRANGGNGSEWVTFNSCLHRIQYWLASMDTTPSKRVQNHASLFKHLNRFILHVAYFHFSQTQTFCIKTNDHVTKQPNSVGHFSSLSPHDCGVFQLTFCIYYHSRINGI